MNDENDSVEVVVMIQGKRTIGGLEYNLYCQRKLKSDAEAVASDLREQGCRVSINKMDGSYAVWWRR